MRASWLLAALLLSLGVAGCAREPGPAQAPAEAGPGANGEVGGLQGSVYDDERRPIEGASVSVLPLAKNDTTDANGRFSFREVPVGEYTLHITKPGFHDQRQNATVAPRRTTSVSILIVPLPADVAYHHTYPYSGHHQCMAYTAVFLGSCSHPYTAAHGTLRANGVNLSQYGAPADVLNNRYRYNFTAERDHVEIVSELVWKAATEASRYFVLQISCPWYNAAVDDCVKPGETTWANENTYARARGVSPLRIEWSGHEFDIYEKQSTWIMSRAYLSGPADRPAGVAVDQKLDMYNTVFYGAPAPPQWSYVAPT